MLSSRGGPDAGAGDTALVRACLGQPVSRTPVWFMRQAGRALPEYRAAGEPAPSSPPSRMRRLAAELTLQPVRRYGVDAAILFSDIVVPLHAVGFGVEVEAGRGPVVGAPALGDDDLDRLRPFVPEADAPYVAEAARLVAAELSGSGVALIGFAGAPFTVASYIVEGGPSRTFARVKALMHSAPDLWDRLMARLADMAVASLRAQVLAGAPGLPALRQLGRSALAHRVRSASRCRPPGPCCPGWPTSACRASSSGSERESSSRLMAGAGSDVVGVDWRVPLDEARRRVGPHRCFAGQPRSRALPGPVAGRRGGDAGRPGGGRGEPDAGGRRARLQPRPRRAARDRPGDPPSPSPTRCTRRRDPAVTVGVLVMAHGTPDDPAEIGPSTRASGGAARPSRRSWPSSRRRYAAIGGVSPLAERTRAQVDRAGRAELDRRSPGRYVVVLRREARRAAHRGGGGPPLAGDRAGRLEKVVGLVLTPHSLVHGLGRVPRAGGRGAGSRRGRATGGRPRRAGALRARRALVRRTGLVELLAARIHGDRWRRGTARRRGLHRPLAARPDRGRRATPTRSSWPTSAGSSRAAAGLDALAVAWQSAGPHPRALARTRRPRRSAAPGRDGPVDAVVVCPVGFVADHLEVLYDLDVEWPRWRPAAGSPTAGRRR